MLNENVLHFYDEHELPMLCILTDRSTEYCGGADQHDYQLYMALTKVKSPQNNGNCERFQKIILKEFFSMFT